MRKFEVVTYYKDKGINLPMRATPRSAGYDFEAAETVEIPSFFIGVQQLTTLIEEKIDRANDHPMTEETYLRLKDYDEKANEISKGLTEFQQMPVENVQELLEIVDDILDDDEISCLEAVEDFRKSLKPVLVPTGIKACMHKDEFLGLYNRSSNPLKRSLILANGVGVIDSDYYNNEDNEGHIMFQFINLGFFPVKIKKGERIGQGIFQKFLTVEETEETREDQRSGGFGSTGVDDTITDVIKDDSVSEVIIKNGVI